MLVLRGAFHDGAIDRQGCDVLEGHPERELRACCRPDDGQQRRVALEGRTDRASLPQEDPCVPGRAGHAEELACSSLGRLLLEGLEGIDLQPVEGRGAVQVRKEVTVIGGRSFGLDA